MTGVGAPAETTPWTRIAARGLGSRRRGTGAGCWLIEMEAGASDAEVAAGVAAHRAATGPVVISRQWLAAEEWSAQYDGREARRWIG